MHRTCKIYLLILPVFLALNLLGISLSAQNSKRVQYLEPDVNFSNTFFDLGEVEEGSDSLATFCFTNKGRGDLLIEEVESSCGCLAINYPHGKISSGQSGKITIRYNTNLVGNIRRSIVVKTNDKKHERTTLILTGQIVKKR